MHVIDLVSYFRLEMKIILDFIPNHTSKNHTWFKLSENKTQGYEDFYIWSETPNNWVRIKMTYIKGTLSLDFIL